MYYLRGLTSCEYHCSSHQGTIFHKPLESRETIHIHDWTEFLVLREISDIGSSDQGTCFSRLLQRVGHVWNYSQVIAELTVVQMNFDELKGKCMAMTPQTAN